MATERRIYVFIENNANVTLPAQTQMLVVPFKKLFPDDLHSGNLSKVVSGVDALRRQFGVGRGNLSGFGQRDLRIYPET